MTVSSGSKWRPSAPLENLQKRAQILAGIRAFFSDRGVMEVETPLLSSAASTDPYLESFTTTYSGPGGERQCYFQTSPEFFMKRLLAAGSGPIYQIGKAFRNGECGDQHNPEFTMLEWYRPGFDHHDLMDEVEALLQQVLQSSRAQRWTYQALFEHYVGINPHDCTEQVLADKALAMGIHMSDPVSISKDTWFSLLLTHVIEPKLGINEPVFVYDFPASQAMLARVVGESPPLAQRFEVYFKGVELANGFYELLDGSEQQRRFNADLIERQAQGLPAVPMDLCLVEALQSGLPDCSGVAIGIDRLVMLALGVECLSDVMAFSMKKV